MPKISIIVPVYNTEKYLAKCFDSILNQTFSDFELICINDGSTDNSLKILGSYQQKDSRVIVINQKNQGVSAARNKGIDLAKGEYLIFIDSDDWVTTNYLALLLSLILKDNSNISICGFVGGSETFINKHCIVFEGNKEVVELFDKIMIQTPVAKMFNKKIIDQFNLKFDISLNFGEDYVFSLEYFSYCKFVNITNKVMYHYFIGTPNSLSKQFNIKRFQDSEIRANLAVNFFKKFKLQEKDYSDYVLGLYYWNFYDAAFYLYNNFFKMEKHKKLEWIKKMLEFKYIQDGFPNSQKMHPILNIFKTKNINKIHKYLYIRKKIIDTITFIFNRQ